MRSISINDIKRIPLGDYPQDESPESLRDLIASMLADDQAPDTSVRIADMGVASVATWLSTYENPIVPYKQRHYATGGVRTDCKEEGTIWGTSSELIVEFTDRTPNGRKMTAAMAPWGPVIYAMEAAAKTAPRLRAAIIALAARLGGA